MGDPALNPNRQSTHRISSPSGRASVRREMRSWISQTPRCNNVPTLGLFYIRATGAESDLTAPSISSANHQEGRIPSVARLAMRADLSQIASAFSVNLAISQLPYTHIGLRSGGRAQSFNINNGDRVCLSALGGIMLESHGTCVSRDQYSIRRKGDSVCRRLKNLGPCSYALPMPRQSRWSVNTLFRIQPTRSGPREGRTIDR